MNPSIVCCWSRLLTGKGRREKRGSLLSYFEFILSCFKGGVDLWPKAEITTSIFSLLFIFLTIPSLSLGPPSTLSLFLSQLALIAGGTVVLVVQAESYPIPASCPSPSTLTTPSARMASASKCSRNRCSGQYFKYLFWCEFRICLF